MKVLGDDEIKFPGNLEVVKARIHRELAGHVKTVAVSKMPDGRYYASLGLRILSTLGTRVAAKGGSVRPKQYGRKSTAVEAAALGFGSPLHTGTPVEGG